MNTTCAQCFKGPRRTVPLKHLALVLREVHPIDPGTPVSGSVLFRWLYHLDRSLSEIRAKQRRGILVFETLPDNQNHVSQTHIALFSAGCQMLSGFLQATSTRWKDDSFPLPAPPQGFTGLTVNQGQSDHFVFVSYTYNHQCCQIKKERKVKSSWCCSFIMALLCGSV